MIRESMDLGPGLDRKVEGWREARELAGVEAWLKGVSMVALPRNLRLVPDTGKPSSKTRGTPIRAASPGPAQGPRASWI